MENTETRKKRVVILGAGFGGLSLYNKMRKNYDLLVIDRKNFFEFTPEVPSTFKDPSKHKNIQIDLLTHLENHDFLQANLTHTRPHTVRLTAINIDNAISMLNDRGWPYERVCDTMPSDIVDDTIDVIFDYCDIAIGAMYPKPIGTLANSLAARKQEKKAVADRLACGNYTGVSIVGGGYVGVEMACYAQDVIKDKMLGLPLRI